MQQAHAHRDPERLIHADAGKVTIDLEVTGR
jgi:hypothetical protein